MDYPNPTADEVGFFRQKMANITFETTELEALEAERHVQGYEVNDYDNTRVSKEQDIMNMEFDYIPVNIEFQKYKNISLSVIGIKRSTTSNLNMTARDILTIGSKDNPPVLFPKDFKIWKDRFLDYVERQENGALIHDSLINGVQREVREQDPDGNDRVLQPKDYTGEHLLRYKADKAARSLVMQSLTNDIYRKVDSLSETGKGMFDELIKLYKGSEVENQMRVSNVINTYGNFKQKDGESLDKTYDRFTTILNDLNSYKISKSIIETNVKFLSVLQPEWKKYAHRMKQNYRLDSLPLQQMFETLKQDEDDADLKKKKLMKKEKKDKKEKKAAGSEKKEEEDELESEPLALVSRKYAKKGKSVQQEDYGLDQNDLDEAESLRRAMILLSKAFQHRFVKTPGSNNQRYSSSSKNFEHKNRIESKKQFDDHKEDGKRPEVKKFGDKKDEEQKCYNCGKTDHFSKECWKPKVRNSDYYKQKALLAEQKESGIELQVEEEYWLDQTDDEGEEDKAAFARMCLMSRDSEDSEADAVSETNEVLMKQVHLKLQSNGRKTRNVFVKKTRLVDSRIALTTHLTKTGTRY